MENELSSMFNASLTEFVLKLIHERIFPSHVVPDIVAEHFITHYSLPCPIDMPETSRLLSKLSMMDVELNPVLEESSNIRGMWCNLLGVTKVVVAGNRPKACLIKTLLHELAEQMLAISYELQPSTRQLSDKVREEWANRFAAMCKMPPYLFLPEAVASGWNLRHLAVTFDDTIAGVGRQIRDIVAMNEVFYSCRFDIVTRPEKTCPKLMELIHSSGSMAVLVHDVVKTPSVCNRNKRRALPQYIVPNTDHYRVVHPAFEQMTTSSRPIYIPRIDGAASFEVRYGDLYGYNDLAVVIQWYGSRKRVKGFFLAAVHPDNIPKIQAQLGDLNVERRTDIDWLFSNEKQIKRRAKKKRPQPGLPIVESNGASKDMSQESWQWPNPPRLLIDTSRS